ncbi:MAG TPA: DHA2 family efflux MFS transporter permease subunit [Hyphomicrobium sp.]|jgi:DHA2 family multidrug resistance protein
MTAPAKKAGKPGISPWLVAFIVSIATFMEVLDISIANVALRHIAGSMGASYDQATWILTSYLIANAVILPASAWLSSMIGRKRFYMTCVALFTASSLLCGLSWSLGSLIFFRVLQGLGGGGLAPSEQAILADAFPPEMRGNAFAVYGIAVVVAPTIGPTLGGFITDYWTWHWIFFMNIPMGILSLFLVGTFVKDTANGEAEKKPKPKRKSPSFDFIGFALVALCLGALEVVLDEGQRSDWFQSNFIIFFAVLSIAALVIFIPWELTRRQPLVNIRLLGTRQFGMCFFMMLVTGGTLFSSIQLMPQLVQNEFGYDATLAGLSLSPGGVMTMLMMPVAGYLTGKIQPKYLIAFGLAIVGMSMWTLTGLSPNLSFGYAVWTRVFTSAGLPFLFIPITTASYAGLKGADTNQAAGLINIARNLGGSVGLALVQTVLQQRQQFHQSRLVENTIPSNIHFQEAIRRATELFQSGHYSAVDAAHHANALVAQTILKQATLLSYIDAFWMLAMLCLIAFPLAFFLRAIPLGKPGPGH